MVKSRRKDGLRFAPYRTFGDHQYYLLASTFDKGEAERSKERAKDLGSLARVVQASVEGRPAYLVYVFRRVKNPAANPAGQQKVDRLNRGR